MTGASRPEIPILLAAVTACAVAVAYAGVTWGNAVFSVLWLELRWSETAAERFVAAASWIAVLAALAGWFRAGTHALWLVTIWIAAIAAATAHTSERHAWLIPGAAAARWLAPVAVVLLRADRTRAATTVLRVGAAATFACHGVAALDQEPAFFDYIVGASRALLGTEFAPATIRWQLQAIGVVDLLVAASILTMRSRVVAAWMALWGLVTAGARIVHSGAAAWDEVLLRLPHAAAPAALFVLFARAQRADRQAGLDA